MSGHSIIDTFKVVNLHEDNDEKIFQSMDTTCSDVTITGLSPRAAGNNFLVVCIGLLSICATSIVAVLMYSNKRLMQHPNKLIFGMCICEAAAAWHAIISHIGARTWICYFNLDTVMMKSNYFSNGSELDTLQVL